MSPGVLYIVATPIGNLGDISHRALEVLAAVDFIAAEDTRRTAVLLNHYGLRSPVRSFHDHNERKVLVDILQRLREGQSIAVVSDAGTPLISDPGFPLVREAHEQGIRVCPIPGPSALICALSAAGLPCDRFIFEGFLPRSKGQRVRRLESMAQEKRTLVVYESSHRLIPTLRDMVQILGGERQGALCRELTKQYETILRGSLSQIIQAALDDEMQQRGEFVLVIGGSESSDTDSGPCDSDSVLRVLAAELPLTQAATLAARITGGNRNELYKRALAMRRQN